MHQGEREISFDPPDRITDYSSEYIQLCCSSEPGALAIKQQIKAILNTLPVNDRHKILRRLENKDNGQFIPALDELLLWDYFLCKGLEPTYEPSKFTNPPDFVLNTNKPPILVELVTFINTEEQTVSCRKEEELKHEISSRFPDYSYCLFIDKPLPNGLRTSEVTDAVLKEIAAANEVAEIPIELNGDRFGKVRIVYDSKNSGWQWSSVPTSDMDSPSKNLQEQVKARLTKKVGIFDGNPENSNIIVLFSHPVFVSNFALKNVLYGRETVRFTVDTSPKPSAEWGRDYSGFFTQKPGLDGKAKNTRISAVIHARRKYDETIGYDLDLSVYHNPFAQKPLSTATFKDCRQLVAETDTQTSGAMHWVDPS